MIENVQMIENRNRGYLYNELFKKVTKKNVQPFKVWLGPLLFIKILLKTAQLFSKHFPSGVTVNKYYPKKSTPGLLFY